MVYQNKIYGFLLQNIYSSSYSPKIVCLRMSSFFLELSPLGNFKSHHHGSKMIRIQNLNQQFSTINPHPNHVIILPP
jgi:hypothetical protein